MSYVKLTDTTIPGIAEAVANALAIERITEDVQQALVDAGSVVQLDDGSVVWLACVLHDKPSTPQIDLITCAIACKDGAPWIKTNGQVVGVAWWSNLWAQELFDRGTDTVRKALQMIALGEPQPQVPIPIPAEGGPTEMDAMPDSQATAHSIRTQIATANEIAAPLNDVL
jgi:hypothetical protein